MRTKLPLLVVLGITLVSIPSLNAQSFLTNGLVAYYPFNGNADDASGNVNNGIITGGGIDLDRFGLADGALKLNGTSDYVTIPDAAANDLPSEFALAFWIKPKTGYGIPVDGNCQIINKWGGGGSGDASYQAGITGSGNLYFATHDGVRTTIMTDTQVTPAELWTHAAIVRTSNDFRIYANGELRSASSSLVQPQQNSVLNLTIGRETGGQYAYYGGMVDDVRIYNRALTSNEVASLYYLESKKNVQLVKMYSLDFDGLYLGTNYQLQVSTNVLTWTNWGSPFTATSVKYTNAIPIQRIDDWGKLFFRLVPQ